MTEQSMEAPINSDQPTGAMELENSTDTPASTEKSSWVKNFLSRFKRQSKNDQPTTGRKRMNKKLKIALLSLLGLLVILGTYTTVIGLKLKGQAAIAQTHATAALDAFKAQNLPGAEQEFAALQTSLADVQHSYRLLGVYNFIPVARWYYQDGQHALTAADAGVKAGLKAVQEITPYADVLGFQGEGSFTGGTAEDRIKLIIETLDKVMPSFDEIAGNLQVVQSEIAAINPRHYPKTFMDRPIREQLAETQETITNGVEGFISFRPVLEQLPDLAGGKGERKKYLILFQNDNELRPTGGFLTAYAVVFIENGKVTPEKSDDIYELDQKFTERIPIPEALGKYLTTEKYWNLRDMNISPDFKTSMDEFF